MKRLLIILSLILSTAAYAQAPDTMWTRTYGGTQPDTGWQVMEDSDGGLIIVGSTMSFGQGGTDVYLIKTNANGDTLWTHTYGDANNNSGKAVAKLLNWWLVIAGYTINPNRGDEDMYFIKCGPDGRNPITRMYGNEQDQQAFCIAVAQDSGFVMAGWTAPPDTHQYSHIYIVRTGNTGQLLWTRDYSNYDQSAVYGIQMIPYSGYVLAGKGYLYYQGTVFLIMSIDRNGQGTWSGDYRPGILRTIILDHWGRVAVGGHFFNPYDSLNAIFAQPNHSVLFPYYEVRSIANTSDNEFVICGDDMHYGADTAFVAKVDTSGQQIWLKQFIGVFATSIIQTRDGGYVFTGVKSNDVFLAKIAPELQTDVNNGNNLYPKEFTLYPNYPNPFNASTEIRYTLAKVCDVNIEIFDIMGRKIATLASERQLDGPHSVAWDAKDAASGVYFYRVKAGEAIETRRCLLLK